ncbi:MAG: hypothetical protein Q8Q60_02080, partial [Candidatus Chromulinivorax sp.]|nr:hypothetical protein [Candidatus Chromulinivorax sp.]
GSLANTSGTATIAGILGDPGAVFGAAATISSILGNPTGVSLAADIITANAAITTLGTAALATSAQAVDILQGSDAAGTVIVGGTTYTADTNDLTAISRGLSAIEGASFTTALASLYIVSRQVALSQVIAAASSTAITTNATAGGGTFGNFNTTLANLRAAIITATAVSGQTNANIDAITSTADLAFTSAATESITAPYTQTAYQAALQALSLASINWSAFY